MSENAVNIFLAVSREDPPENPQITLTLCAPLTQLKPLDNRHTISMLWYCIILEHI